MRAGNAAFLVFVVVPLVELLLLVWIGTRIGFWWTVALVLATGVLGGILARLQGARAWRDITGAWRSGRVPAPELVSGALFLVGAAFLITPGVLTDALGLLLMVPWLRRLVARRVIARFRARAAGPARAAHAPEAAAEVISIRTKRDEP